MCTFAVAVLALLLVAALALPVRAQLPGRQQSPTPVQVDEEGWTTLGILQRHEDTGVLRLLPLATPTPDAPTDTPPPTATRTPTPSATVTPTPTATATSTPTATNTPGQGEPSTPTPEDQRTPTSTPVPSDTPTPPPTTEPGGCVVRSLANVWARTLPVVREDTKIAVLPADSPIHIDAYTLEHTADATYVWYRYWFDVDHPEAWSRADLFTERADSAACELLPEETP